MRMKMRMIEERRIAISFSLFRTFAMWSSTKTWNLGGTRGNKREEQEGKYRDYIRAPGVDRRHLFQAIRDPS